MLIQEIQAADTWPIRKKVMWPRKPIQFVQLKEDLLGVHYGLFKGTQLCSVISCFEEQRAMQFRKFATLVEVQNQGLGTVLLQFVITEARDRGMERLWCNAREDKMGFYQKFGFTATNTRFVREGIVYIVLELHFS